MAYGIANMSRLLADFSSVGDLATYFNILARLTLF
jgi:hypothetical protein